MSLLHVTRFIFPW